jgi:hypothetical protein
VSDTKTVATNSFPTATVLTILFVILKVTGYIHWSWWFVFAPFWIPFSLFMVIAGGILGIAFVVALLEK